MRCALVLVVLAACSSEKQAPVDESVAPYCDPEASQIAGALEATLAAPAEHRAGAFETATSPFANASMCGPDMAQIVRDLQAHFKANGSDAERNALLLRFEKEATYVASKKWRMPAALAKRIEAAKQ